MTIASGHTGDLASGSINSAVRVSGQRPLNRLPRLAALSLVSAMALFAVSLLLPEQDAQLALDLMSWCLVGTLAAGVLFASVKVLENLLDL